MNQPQISVIVPVYNVEKYLSRCIESILSQTFTDFELLLIDDGSTDRSGEICDEYAKKDTRIRVFHTKNRGVSAARNLGLDNAKGEWISFVDSDDWVECNHFQSFVSQFNDNVDLCINSFIANLSYGAKSFHYPNLITKNKIHSIEIFFTILQPHSQFLWNKIFKKEIIKNHNIQFNTKLNLGEDNVFILEYINYVKLISSSFICTYHYDQTDENPLSLGRRKRTKEELCYQLTANCDTILKLYNKYKLPVIFEYASNYLYTRIFQRIIVPNIQYKSCFTKILPDPVKYIRCSCKLDCTKISDKFIRTFWSSIETKKQNYAWIVLNIYIIKTWLKSKIIKTVVVAKHVFRNVPSIALH